jgi:hypothetical protein
VIRGLHYVSYTKSTGELAVSFTAALIYQLPNAKVKQLLLPARLSRLVGTGHIGKPSLFDNGGHLSDLLGSINQDYTFGGIGWKKNTIQS